MVRIASLILVVASLLLVQSDESANGDGSPARPDRRIRRQREGGSRGGPAGGRPGGGPGGPGGEGGAGHVNENSKKWAANIDALRAFVDREGHAKVPVEYSTPEAPKLGTWLLRMQRHMNGGDAAGDGAPSALTTEGKNLLSSLGVQPLPPEEAKAAAAAHAARKRAAHGGAANMTDTQKRALADEVFKRAITALRKYSVDHHGNADVPRAFVDEGGLKVGLWLAKLRRAAVRGTLSTKLSDEQVASLETLLGKSLSEEPPMEEGGDGGPGGAKEDHFRTYMNALKRYKAREGDVLVPKKHKEAASEDPSGVNGVVEHLRLGGWLKAMQSRAARGELPEAWQKQLEALGVVVGGGGGGGVPRQKQSRLGGAAGAGGARRRGPRRADRGG